MPNTIQVTRVFVGQVFDEDDFCHRTVVGFTPESAHLALVDSQEEDEVVPALASFELGKVDGDDVWGVQQPPHYWTIRSLPLHTAVEKA